MATKAQIKASSKYNKENLYRFSMDLNKKTDVDLIEWLNRQPSKMGAVKKVLREYIEKEK